MSSDVSSLALGHVALLLNNPQDRDVTPQTAPPLETMRQAPKAVVPIISIDDLIRSIYEICGASVDKVTGEQHLARPTRNAMVPVHLDRLNQRGASAKVQKAVAAEMRRVTDPEQI